MRTLRIVLVTIVLGLVPALTMAVPQTVRAQMSTITLFECTYPLLAAAVAAAGSGVTINLECDPGTTIEFEDQITIDTSITIDGTLSDGSPITFDGGGSTGLFSINNGVRATIRNVTMQGGQGDSGGAIENGGTLTIEQSAFSGNQASFGGAISNRGTLEIAQSSFSGNSADHFGGAIDNLETLTITQSSFINNSAEQGGAIHNFGRSLTIKQSSFSGNQAEDWAGAIDHNDGDLILIASTLEDNAGAALFVHSTVETTMVRWSTIVQPPAAGAALVVGIGQSVTLEGVILAGPDASCGIVDESSATNDSSTIADDDSCQLDNTVGSQVIDPGLPETPTSEVINGVPQVYYLPEEDSPAIDSGGTDCAGLVDQVGTGRPQGNGCDIGAIELPTVELCANRWNGSLRMPSAGCSGNETLLTLPDDGPITICANAWNGDARYSPSGSCGWSETAYEATGEGSLSVCVNRWNGSLRVSAVCSGSERSEAI